MSEMGQALHRFAGAHPLPLRIVKLSPPEFYRVEAKNRYLQLLEWQRLANSQFANVLCILRVEVETCRRRITFATAPAESLPR